MGLNPPSLPESASLYVVDRDPVRQGSSYLRAYKALKINQKRRYSPTKIEKSKKILSPFLTSTYVNHKSTIDHFFRLKRAGSPYYRGLSFSLPEFTRSLSSGAAYLTRSRGMLAHLLFCRGAARPRFLTQ